MQDPGIYQGLGKKGMRRRLDSLPSPTMALVSVGLVVLVVIAWVWG